MTPDFEREKFVKILVIFAQKMKHHAKLRQKLEEIPEKREKTRITLSQVTIG
jgi:hypothetical protein